MARGYGMFGKKKQDRKRAGLQTALLQVQAARARDAVRARDLIVGTGPETTDESLWSAMELFLGIAREVPSVRTSLMQQAAAAPPDAQVAFASALAVVDSGNSSAFQGGNPEGQLRLMMTLPAIVAQDAAGSRLFDEMVARYS